MQNIMLGQLAPLGTGSFGLMLDEARLADAIEVSYAPDLDLDALGRTPGRMTPGRSPGGHMTPSRMSPSGAAVLPHPACPLS